MRPGRLAAGGPPRGPRTSHGRERARSGGETLAAAGPAGTQYGTAALGAHPEAKAMGLGALAIVGLVRALQGRAPSRRSRPVRSRGPCGRRKRPRVRPRSGSAQCGAPSIWAGRDIWGKPLQPLVAQGHRCYVARLARPPACCPAHSDVSQHDPGRTRHIRGAGHKQKDRPMGGLSVQSDRCLYQGWN